MRYLLSLFITVGALLFAGCRRPGGNDETNNLAGTWTMDARNRDGSEFQILMVVSADGHYAQHITGHSPDGQPVSSDLEGTIRAKDGLLTTVNTKHSSPYAPVPTTNQARIVGISDSELRFVPASAGGDSISTNDIRTFRRSK
jgi:hypothetical protein